MIPTPGRWGVMWPTARVVLALHSKPGPGGVNGQPRLHQRRCIYIQTVALDLMFIRRNSDEKRENG